MCQQLVSCTNKAEHAVHSYAARIGSWGAWGDRWPRDQEPNGKNVMRYQYYQCVAILPMGLNDRRKEEEKKENTSS